MYSYFIVREKATGRIVARTSFSSSLKKIIDEHPGIQLEYREFHVTGREALLSMIPP